MVRPGRRGARDRVERDVLRNDCFQRLRRELGEGFDDETARRVTAVAGDVTVDGLGLDDAGRDVLSSCSTVIHSAATVSFDAPLDAAVEVNLLGPSRVAALSTGAAGKHGGQSRGAPPPDLRFDRLRGRDEKRPGPGGPAVRDALFGPGPWRAEVDAARRARSDAEAASRDPKQLARLRGRSPRRTGRGRRTPPGREDGETAGRVDRRPHGRARQGPRPGIWVGRTPTPTPKPWANGPFSRAAAPCRSRWCGPPSSRPRFPNPIRAGSAASGWPTRSSSATPAACSRSSPGSPRASSTSSRSTWWSPPSWPWPPGGRSSSPDVVHAASGARNPLRYGQLVNLVREWFSEHPLADDKGQPIEVPEWSFPGRRRVQNQLRQATKALRGAERVLAGVALAGQQGRARQPHRRTPRRGRAGPRLRRALRRLHRDRSRLRRGPSPRAQEPAEPRRGTGVLLRPARVGVAPLLPRRLPAGRGGPRPGAPGVAAPQPPARPA